MTEKRFYLNEGEVNILKILDLKENNETIYHTALKSDMEMVVELLNELHEENYKIKSLLLKKVEELNNAYNESAKAGMPTGGIIGELDSFEEICRIMRWIE